MYNGYTFGEYDVTQTFTDVFESFDDFKSEYNSLPTSLKNVVSNNDYSFLEQVYYGLYSKYGNSHISNADINQFKYKLFMLIFTDGPIAKKKMELQNAIRSLDLSSDDVLGGTKSIWNHANNPSTSPSTGALDELPYIDDQSTSNIKRTKLDAYARMYDMLSNDVFNNFISKFKKLFIVVVKPNKPLLYESEE